MCSTTYRHALMLDHISENLEDELKKIGLFKEEDIWLLIDSIIGAMAVF